MSGSNSKKSTPALTRYAELQSDHTKTKFVVCGEEMVHKQVTASGGSGRVYLPMGWLGKHVKIVRLD